MKNKGLKILLSVLLVLCIIMAGALIGKEYIGDNIKEAANRNGVDVVRDTSDTGKEDENAVDSTAEGTANTQSDAAKAEATEADKQQPQMSTIVITATGDCTLGNNQEQSYDGSFNSYYDSKGQDYFFGGVRDIFEADDMTLINLECVLSDATERVEKRWNLKGKPELHRNYDGQLHRGLQSWKQSHIRLWTSWTGRYEKCARQCRDSVWLQ